MKSAVHSRGGLAHHTSENPHRRVAHPKERKRFGYKLVCKVNGMRMPRLTYLVSFLAIAGCSSTSAENAVYKSAPDCARPVVDKVEKPNVVWTPGKDGSQIPLWPEGADIQIPKTDGNAEMVGSGSPLIAGRTWNWATYITKPTMIMYQPKGANTGATMLVLPGGGYAAVAMDLEGTEICDWITDHGVTCVILKYRTPQLWQRAKDGTQVPPDEVLLPLEDAQRAMGLLRENAKSYEIDPHKIGVIGFSSGAHLAAAVSNAESRTYDKIDTADQQPSQPDYAIIMYPGRYLPVRKPGTNLELAPWMEINESAPPTLLMHTMDDEVNDVRHSMAYALALNKVDVPVDMRIFAKGCHAFGLRPTTDPVTTQWPNMAVDWLASIDMFR